MNKPRINNILKDGNYIKGKPTAYYILTIKSSVEIQQRGSLRYDVIVLEGRKLIEQAKVESGS